MNKLMLILLLALCPMLVNAQEADKQLAEKAMAATGFLEGIDYMKQEQASQIKKAMLEPMKKSIPCLTDAAIDSMAQDIVALMKTAIKEDELKARITTYYQKNFTNDELKDMTKFYESLVGKKMVGKTGEMAQLLQPDPEVIQSIIPQMGQIMAKYVDSKGQCVKK